jgi:mxaD protein
MTPSRRALVAMLAAFAALPATAHGPTPQRVEREVVLSVAPDRLWALVSDFSAIMLWHPDIEDAVLTGGNQRGSRRSLTLAGGRLVEGIDDIDDAALSLRWRLSEENPEAFPASFYMHSMSLYPEGAGVRMRWTANLYRADTGNYPEKGRDDAAAVSAMERFLDRGIEGLVAALGTGAG